MLPFSFFDAHCDTLSCCLHLGWDLRSSPGHTDLERGGQFQRYAQVFAIFHDAARAPMDGMFAECCRQAEEFFVQMKRNAALVAPCRTAADLEQTERAGKCAAILSIEGADLLECDPARLETAAQWGVRLINLTWNRANALSGSHLEEPERGLSAQGKDFVRRAQSLGILVDVSHLSDAGFWDLMDQSEKPVVASHSDARALCSNTRNLTDEMFRCICAAGGFAGLNFYTPFLGLDHSLDAVFAHLEHFLDLGGEKYVGFGGDWDGCDRLPDGICGVQDMERIYEGMLRRNYSAELIEDLFYRNLKRVIFEQSEQ